MVANSRNYRTKFDPTPRTTYSWAQYVRCRLFYSPGLIDHITDQRACGLAEPAVCGSRHLILDQQPACQAGRGGTSYARDGFISGPGAYSERGFGGWASCVEDEGESE